MQKNPLVSLIVPCYNMEKYIGRLIQSVIDQTYRPLELIIVNDGSSDSSEKIIFDYKEQLKEKKVKFIYKYQENQGLGGAINTGLKLVHGEYFGWPDADDYLEPTSVEERVRVFQQHSDCAVVTSDAYLRKCEDLSHAFDLISSHFPKSNKPWQFELMLEGESIFCPGCHLVSTQKFDEVNPQREIYKARRGQNWQLLLPLYYKYKRFFLSKPLYNYIIYPNSMSKGDDTEKRLIYRYKSQLKILINTLRMIENFQFKDMHSYEAKVKNIYVGLCIRVYYRFKNKKMFDIYWKIKKKLYGITFRDIVVFLKSKFLL